MTLPAVRRQMAHGVVRGERINNKTYWHSHCPICGYVPKGMLTWYQHYHTMNAHMHLEHGGKT